MYKGILISCVLFSHFAVIASDEDHAEATQTARSGQEVSQQCVSCHGTDGNSPTSNFPRIAGQYEDYLFHALKAYKNGERKNPIMAGIVAALSEKEMKNVSAFYAKQIGLTSIDVGQAAKE